MGRLSEGAFVPGGICPGGQVSGGASVRIPYDSYNKLNTAYVLAHAPISATNQVLLLLWLRLLSPAL